MSTVIHRSAAIASALVFLVVVLALAACSSAGLPVVDDFPAAPFLIATSASGALRVAVRTSPQPLARGSNDLQLTVTDASSGSVRDDLAVTVVPWMPAMDHGASTIPAVTPKGEGKYLVTGVDLFMPGHWELRMSLAGPSPDNVVVASDIP